MITGGTQDNGSWETLGDTETWINTNIADGGHNAYDALGGNPNFRLTAWQAGSLLVSFTPQDQVDITWIADTINFLPPYVNEAVPFIGNAITDPVQPGWLWTAREHVFRSTQLRPESRRSRGPSCSSTATSGSATSTSTRTAPTSRSIDICDDWQPLGDPGPERHG